MDLILNQKHFDFGGIQYTVAGSSRSLVVELSNASEENEYSVSLSIYSNLVNDFPVSIIVDKWLNESEEVIENVDSYRVKARGGKLKAVFRLVINDSTINMINPRTSYFKVANRCSFQFKKLDKDDQNVTQSAEPEMQKIEFSFSAMLCTSIMFIEKTEIDFQEANIHETNIQEIMIWNRSESELQFRIRLLGSDSPTSDSTTDTISFYEVDSDEPIGDKAVSVPSFAPKIIQVHLNGQVIAFYLCLYTKY